MGQLYFETLLNGVQFGVFLFLISAGLTLVFGIMSMVNLAHGSLFMMGAYIGSYVFQQTDSFLLAVVAAIPFSLVLGIALEYLALRTLYARDHLDQVLATFGLILFFNQLVLRVFGATSQEFRLPDAINFPMQLSYRLIAVALVICLLVALVLWVLANRRMDLSKRIAFVGSLWAAGAFVIWVRNYFPTGPSFSYPSYRLIVIAVGLLVAIGLFLVIAKTRIGMLIRAGASNRPMAGALGVNIRMLYTLIFGIGAALAGLAGVMIGPIESVESGMGESKLILAFVVIVIGGIGSIRGAFIASILVGLVEVIGRVFMKDFLRDVLRLPDEFAQTAGPALASMSIYILMAGVLYFRPQGLFPARTG